jgi:hypothetical protein
LKGSFPAHCVELIDGEQAQAESAPVKRSVTFLPEEVTQTLDALSNEEYDRKGEFNPSVATAEWAKEEPEEKLRMQEDRWQYMEKNLGVEKCEERLAYEKQQQELEEKRKADEEKKKAERLEKKRQFLEAK